MSGYAPDDGKKKNALLASRASTVYLVRHLAILEQVASGPVLEGELKKLCFTKIDPHTGEPNGECSYTNMRRILKRLITERYLKRKKYRASASSKKIYSVYVLGAAGIPEITNRFDWEPDHIRRTFPRQGVLSEAVILSSIVRTIRKEAVDKKRYVIEVLCDGTAYKKMLPKGTGSGMCLPESYLLILPRNPNIQMVSAKGRMELMILIDTGRITESAWKKKLKSFQNNNVLLITLCEKKKMKLLDIAAQTKNTNVFLATHHEFCKNGLTNTTWDCINAKGNRELVKLPL